MRRLLIIIILSLLVGCQENSSLASLTPTLVSQSVTFDPIPTRHLRAVVTRAMTPTHTALPTRPPTETLLPTYTALPLLETPIPLNGTFSFGQSVLGTPLTAHRLGTGAKVIVLVGGIHGGWEVNTTQLMNELIAHYQANPAQIQPGVSLLIVPQLNPDGAARGRVLEGRFNQHLVDLNRNWGCGWQATAYFRSQVVDPGGSAFSEPETQALSELILNTRPSVVLFYHSAADGIFAGDCGDFAGISESMVAVYGRASGYPYEASFSDYPVTGTAPAWVTAQGIPSADVELSTWRETEFDRNLRGIQALQCWLVNEVSCR
jgi:hypothetical protein